MNERLKTIKIITVALTVFIVLLFTAMIINFISLAKVNSRKKDLEEKLNYYSGLSSDYSGEIAYKESDEFIEMYAREQLNMQGEGEQAFEG